MSPCWYRRERSTTTPSVSEFLLTFSFDPIVTIALVIGGLLYAWGLVAVKRRGERWPAWRAWLFYLLGLGSYAWIQYGVLGTWSHDLRWAFTTRVALLLFMVPPFIALGGPITLMRRALPPRGLKVLEAVLRSWPVRLMGNAIFAPLVPLAGFSLFLTPIAGPLRIDTGWSIAITLLVPLGGMVMTLPIAEDTDSRSSNFIIYEFLLSIVEVMLDAVPGIFMRLNPHVLDGVGAITHTALGAALPAWFPTPLRDQQLAGDLLWFFAEMADLPVIIALFLRWGHVDRKDAQKVDALSDEEYEAAMRAHLSRRG